MTTVVFLHGVGGPLPGWDSALVAAVAQRAPEFSAGLNTATLRFDDLVNQKGAIRKQLAPTDQSELVEAVRNQASPVAWSARRPFEMHTDPRRVARLAYFERQARLRALTWSASGRVADPRWRVPVVIPGEVMVRMPWLDMRQAGHYRHDSEIRRQVLDRLSSEIAAIDDDVVLFAHSLGSVVALDMLHLRDIEVGMFISFGSPLGLRHFWGQAWESDHAFAFERIGSWLNVTNLRDPVPWQRGVSHRFPQAVDAFVTQGDGFSGDNGYHDAATYSRSEPVVVALASHMRDQMSGVDSPGGAARI